MATCTPDDAGKCINIATDTFDFGVRLGLVFVVESACMSAIAVTWLLGYIGFSVSKLHASAVRKWSAATHVHWYFLNLLLFELVQAVGGLIDVKWIAEAKVTEGTTCKVQGAMKQAGDVGVALATLAIALHTFSSLVFRWRPQSSSRLQFCVMALSWIFVILIVSLSLGTHRNKDYYGNTEYWCWITSKYPVQRVVLEYMWMWITGFLNFLLYVPMALVIAYDGTVVVSAWRIRFVRNNNFAKTDNRLEMKLALKMLVYPAVYTVTVMPIAICRWLAFTGHEVSWAATVFSDVLFASSGFFNVLLFTLTRPNLLPNARDRPITLNPRKSGVGTMSGHSRMNSADPDNNSMLYPSLFPPQTSPAPSDLTKIRHSTFSAPSYK